MLWLAVFLDVAVAVPPSPGPAWHAACHDELLKMRTDLGLADARILTQPDKLHFVSITSDADYTMDISPRRPTDVASLDWLWVKLNNTDFVQRIGRDLILRIKVRGPISKKFIDRAQKAARVCLDAAPLPAWMTRCAESLRPLGDVITDDNHVKLLRGKPEIHAAFVKVLTKLPPDLDPPPKPDPEEAREPDRWIEIRNGRFASVQPQAPASEELKSKLRACLDY
jgi:hypothetical protein